jgi:hypothetical protein
VAIIIYTCIVTAKISPRKIWGRTPPSSPLLPVAEFCAKNLHLPLSAPICHHLGPKLAFTGVPRPKWIPIGMSLQFQPTLVIGRGPGRSCSPGWARRLSSSWPTWPTWRVWWPSSPGVALWPDLALDGATWGLCAATLGFFGAFGCSATGAAAWVLAVSAGMPVRAASGPAPWASPGQRDGLNIHQYRRPGAPLLGKRLKPNQSVPRSRPPGRDRPVCLSAKSSPPQGSVRYRGITMPKPRSRRF